MTAEELSKLIGEFLPYPSKDQHYALRSFARIVAAAEREKVAKWMIQRSYATGHGDTIEDLLAELDWQITENWNRAMIKGIETEREATIEDARTIGGEAGVEMEKLIRARGQG